MLVNLLDMKKALGDIEGKSFMSYVRGMRGLKMTLKTGMFDGKTIRTMNHYDIDEVLDRLIAEDKKASVIDNARRVKQWISKKH